MWSLVRSEMNLAQNLMKSGLRQFLHKKYTNEINNLNTFLYLVCKMTKRSNKQSTIRKSKRLKELSKKDIDVSNQPIIKEPI